jgi:recombination protein RecR
MCRRLKSCSTISQAFRALDEKRAAACVHILYQSAGAREGLCGRAHRGEQHRQACEVCCNLATPNAARSARATRANKSILCVVRTPRDVAAFERTREYSGLYHVLHGLISPMTDRNPSS